MVEVMLVSGPSGAPTEAVWAPISDFNEEVQEVINREVGERSLRECDAVKLFGYVTMYDHSECYAYRAEPPKTVEWPKIHFPF